MKLSEEIRELILKAEILIGLTGAIYGFWELCRRVLADPFVSLVAFLGSIAAALGVLVWFDTQGENRRLKRRIEELEFDEGARAVAQAIAEGLRE